ncbi:uracil-DNA glycosylase [Niveibacterium sp. SC-1]|uniref:uracil-DNA glycosylase n=1 Tax=Niveibacterium sp. SC-1 TaxID=3135646 RepID=UPI0031203B3C
MNKEIFKQLGLGPRWVLREAPQADASDVAEADALGSLRVEAAAESPTAESPVAAARAALAPAAAPSRRPAAGQTAPGSAPPSRPVSRTGAVPAPAVPTAREAVTDSEIAALDWEALEARVKDCRQCGLCERRKQAVFGVGDKEADWLLVGEGPGAEEDERGEPFVGQAGKLLDAMLESLGLERGRGVYIANSVKCRPPNNRTPEPEEVAACFPYLERQIALIKPKLIVALGRPAAMALLGQEVRIGAARGQRFDYRGIPVVVTYHPAYLLRNLNDKAKSWEDLLFARRLARAATA